jgi:hypothetical protein
VTVHAAGAQVPFAAEQMSAVVMAAGSSSGGHMRVVGEVSRGRYNTDVGEGASPAATAGIQTAREGARE